jgi:hypothetical protein
MGLAIKAGGTTELYAADVAIKAKELTTEAQRAQRRKGIEDKGHFRPRITRIYTDKNR